MSTSTSIKYALALLPAFAMGIPAAYADDKDCDCPCASERTSTTTDRSQGQHDRDNAAIASASSRSDRDATSRSDRDQQGSAARAGNQTHFVSNKPADGYYSDNLIGRDVMNTRDNEVVGTVDELLFDTDGQIKAVIVGTGGILGMGEKDVAISWDQINRRIDGDDIVLSVNLPTDGLKNAPKFARR